MAKLQEFMMDKQLPNETMKKAVKGISYISHPLRLRILEYLDVNGASSVSAITKALDAEQAIISQSLKKMRDSHLVKTSRHGLFVYAYLFITLYARNIRQAFSSASENSMPI